MRQSLGCPGVLLIAGAVMLGVYALVIIPISNFASGSTGEQNAGIIPDLVIAAVTFILGMVFMGIASSGEPSDGGGYTSSSDSQQPSSGQSAFGGYYDRIGKLVETEHAAQAQQSKQNHEAIGWHTVPTKNWPSHLRETSGYKDKLNKERRDAGWTSSL